MVTRESMRRCARLGAVLALAGAGAVGIIGSGTAGAEPVTEEFAFTGEAQEFVVPAGVCSLSIDAFGAQGGSGAGFDPETGEGVGGEGGRATATITVTPGETLLVYVGEEGHDGGESIVDAAADEDPDDNAGDVAPAGLPADSLGGFNGGGDGGGASDELEDAAGGGGGASDVRQGGDTLENRAVVAGGGGGGGGDSDESGGAEGGDGGGLEGTAGQPPGSGTSPGQGGTQTEGGASGVDDDTSTDGELGVGGTGGIGAFDNDGGGGGGGGYFGGGGGDGDTISDDGAGGGGGSGFGPAGTEFETGNQFGDGLVILSYDAAVQTCALPVVVEPTFTG